MKATMSMGLRILMLACLSSVQGWATGFAERGTAMFMENRPQEAAPLLEQAIREPGADERLALYLGISYQQMGRWDDSVTAFRKGLAASSQYRHQFLFNIGNSFFAQGKSAFAVDYYTQALEARDDYAPAYLNRANAKMKLGDVTGAVSDYAVYLGLQPSSPQAGEIRRLIDLVGAKAAAVEQQKAVEEARKIAAEQARAAMLEAVTRSLLEAAESTTNLSAGSGDVQGYESDLSLDE